MCIYDDRAVASRCRTTGTPRTNIAFNRLCIACNKQLALLMASILVRWASSHKKCFFCRPYSGCQRASTEYIQLSVNYLVPLDMKECICHFTKWQIHPFISKGTTCALFPGLCPHICPWQRHSVHTHTLTYSRVQNKASFATSNHSHHYGMK